MFKFFVSQKEQNFFILDKKIQKHIKVVRIKNENFICVYEEKFFLCKLENDKAFIVKEIKENHEFLEPVIIGVPIIKIKKFEWLIEKATELGNTKLIPIITNNISDSHKFLKIYESKKKRWDEIILNASQQSFRNKKMQILKPMPFDKIINLKIKNKFIAYTKDKNTLQTFFPQNSLFLIGPEGGFTKEEILKAQKANFKIMSLGSRILRTETASILLLSRIKINSK